MKDTYENMNGESVYLDGYKFSVERGYYCNRKLGRLHRYLWEKVHGTIPEGCVLHHKDHNKLNNSLDNLEVMTKSDHMRYHAYDHRSWVGSEGNIEHCRATVGKALKKSLETWVGSDEHMKQLDSVRGKAIENAMKSEKMIAWRASEENRQRMRELAKRTHKAGVEASHKPKEYTCVVCGKGFIACSPRAKFCSKECRKTHRKNK